MAQHLHILTFNTVCHSLTKSHFVKIIIPMWIDRPNHWVVLVVYMEDRAIYLLDSLKERRSATRVNLAKKLVMRVILAL